MNYTAKELREIEALREAVSDATGRYCTIAFNDALTYVWSDGVKIGYISGVSRRFTFVPKGKRS